MEKSRATQVDSKPLRFGKSRRFWKQSIVYYPYGRATPASINLIENSEEMGMECPSLDARRYERVGCSPRQCTTDLWPRDTLSRSNEDTRRQFTLQKFFGVEARPVGSDRYNWFLPFFLSVADAAWSVVNKTRDIS